jgi:hypothetical protein
MKHLVNLTPNPLRRERETPRGLFFYRIPLEVLHSN